MKPLFTGEFCPRDCDRVPRIDPATGSARDAIRRNLGLDEDYYIPKRRVTVGVLDRLVDLGFAPMIYSPEVPLIISNVLVEPKPMEMPKGLIFSMDIRRVIEENSVKTRYATVPFRYDYYGTVETKSLK